MMDWLDVVDKHLEKVPPIRWGKGSSDASFSMLERFLRLMSCYKFATKMIGKGKRVLDVGSGEGFGTFLLGKECGFAHGIDLDEEVIEVACANFTEPWVAFERADFLRWEGDKGWDAVVSFDVIEEIVPETKHPFLDRVVHHLTPEGIAVISGSVDLEKEMKSHFSCTFTFGALGEVIHAGSFPLVDYFIIMGCKKR